MTVQPGDELASELYPNIAAVAANYGDPNGKYAAFLANADNTYPAQPYFLWDQPFTDSNLAAATPTANSQPTTTSSSHNGVFVSSHPSSMTASFMTLFLTCVLLVIWWFCCWIYVCFAMIPTCHRFSAAVATQVFQYICKCIQLKYKPIQAVGWSVQGLRAHCYVLSVEVVKSASFKLFLLPRNSKYCEIFLIDLPELLSTHHIA